MVLRSAPQSLRTGNNESDGHPVSDALVFNRDMTFEYGEPHEVSGLVRRIVANNPSPFTFTGTGTYLVGRGTVAVIDPGPLDDAHYQALISALDGETVSHILITHTHRDHSPLAARLAAATGAKTHAYGPHGSGRQAAIAIDEALSLDAGGDRDFAPDVVVGHGDVIEGPGWTLEAVFTPGHTSNHLSFALREENALFSGDHVMAWSTSVVAPPDGHMGDYMASLDAVLARGEETYWPTHGPAVTRPQRFVTKLAQHRRAREAMILARLRAGDRTIAEMVPKIYGGLDPRLVPAASLSTLAHVVDLIEREVVETDGPVSMTGTFRVR